MVCEWDKRLPPSSPSCFFTNEGRARIRKSSLQLVVRWRPKKAEIRSNQITSGVKLQKQGRRELLSQSPRVGNKLCLLCGFKHIVNVSSQTNQDCIVNLAPSVSSFHGEQERDMRSTNVGLSAASVFHSWIHCYDGTFISLALAQNGELQSMEQTCSFSEKYLLYILVHIVSLNQFSTRPAQSTSCCSPSG